MSAQAVEEYLEATRTRRLTSGRSEDQLALERKTSAQRLARSATARITDRKVRAEAKVAVYNHIMPILERHYDAERQLHRTYRRLLAGTCGALLISVLVVIGLVSVSV